MNEQAPFLKQITNVWRCKVVVFNFDPLLGDYGTCQPLCPNLASILVLMVLYMQIYVSFGLFNVV